MQRIIFTLIIVLAALSCFAGKIHDDIASADALMTSGKYAEAKAAYSAFLSTHKNASEKGLLVDGRIGLSRAIRRLGDGSTQAAEAEAVMLPVLSDPAATEDQKYWALSALFTYAINQGKYDEALAMESSLINNPIARKREIFNVKARIATTLLRHMHQPNAAISKVDEALAVADPQVEPGPNGPSYIQYANAFSIKGNALWALNRRAEASLSYAEYICYAIGSLGATNSLIQQAYTRIVPNLMPAEQYRQSLSNILKATPATESNAEFLGRVKSEYEKVK